jgi:hypothetical protein
MPAIDDVAAAAAVAAAGGRRAALILGGSGGVGTFAVRSRHDPLHNPPPKKKNPTFRSLP